MDASNLRGPDPLDPYRAMEDNASEPVQAWLKSQMERAQEYFTSRPMRQTLRDRFLKLFSVATVATPYPRGGKYYTSVRAAGQDKGVIYVQDTLTDEPRVVIDPNEFPAKTTALTGWSPSRDSRLLAYEISLSGNDKSSIHVRDLTTGEDLPDVIPDDFYPNFNGWNADNTGFWYTKHDPDAPVDEPKLHQRLYFHRLGTAWQDDQIVFGLGLDKECHLSGGLSPDKRYFMIQVYGQDREDKREWNEVYLRRADEPDSQLVCIVPRRPATRYSAFVHRDRVYVQTNEEAPKWRLFAMDIEAALAGSLERTVILPEGEWPIEEIECAGDRLFVGTIECVHTVLREYDLDGRLLGDLPLPTIGSGGGFSCRAEGKELFYSFYSFGVPYTVYRRDLTTGETTVHAQMEAGFDASQVVTEQVWVQSKDATWIPMFLVYLKGLVRDGHRPTVLYGYGGFNISLTPSFTKSIVPLLESGGVYAIANLRGGAEFGEKWHEAGTRFNKQNVFDDFAAAARWLMKSGYTRRERLAISGGSNGGLLTLVTAIQNPDLVGAVISDVPVADMLRFHIFDGGIYWIPDYGDPDDPAMREYLLGYSPYHNVRDGERYPAMLVATSDGDDRVHPSHSYKVAARLMEANASDRPIYLRVELGAGHGGAHAISMMAEQEADEWSFIFDQLGVE